MLRKIGGQRDEGGGAGGIVIGPGIEHPAAKVAQVVVMGREDIAAVVADALHRGDDVETLVVLVELVVDVHGDAPGTAGNLLREQPDDRLGVHLLAVGLVELQRLVPGEDEARVRGAIRALELLEVFPVLVREPEIAHDERVLVLGPGQVVEDLRGIVMEGVDEIDSKGSFHARAVLAYGEIRPGNHSPSVDRKLHIPGEGIDVQGEMLAGNRIDTGLSVGLLQILAGLVGPVAGIAASLVPPGTQILDDLFILRQVLGFRLQGGKGQQEQYQHSFHDYANITILRQSLLARCRQIGKKSYICVIMKAIQITQPFELNVIDVEMPACGEGEVLLRIRYVGFCGSDLNTWRGGNAMAKAGVIPGHEVGAEIAAVGPGVPDTLRPGMTVTVDPYTACGHCASCRNGRFNACEFNETLGVQRDGAMREFFVVPWQKVIVTEGLAVRDCALVEPLSVGFHAVSRAQVTENDVVAVFGCGMIGMGAIIGAALRGATVVAMDIDDEKLEVAKAVGAKYTVNTAYEDVQEGISELTNGLLADVVIEAVGLPVTQRQAIANVGFTGRVVFIGYAKDQTTFRTPDFVKKELDIRGSRNACPEDFRTVIEYLQRGTCPYDKLITSVIKPEEAADAMRHWHENPGKVFRILVEF